MSHTHHMSHVTRHMHTSHATHTHTHTHNISCPSVIGLLFYINLGRIEQERIARAKRAKDGVAEEEAEDGKERKCVRWGGNSEKKFTT